MQIFIRQYENSDKDACLAAFKSNVPLYFTEGEVNDFTNFLIKIANAELVKQQENTVYYVVVYDGKVVGCGGFGDKDKRQILTLAWGLIHSDFHKKGLGKLLLEHRLAQIELHFPDLPLVIDTSQHTFTFFEKYGFETTKITNDFYADGLHRYDMIFKKKYFA